jgi:hypothetical protein
MNRRLAGANEADDPFWIDGAWLDTVVTVGLTCFILCLQNLSKVRFWIQFQLSSLIKRKGGLLALTYPHLWIGLYFQDGHALRNSGYGLLDHCILDRSELYF